jgi:hypothetical protein
MMMLSIIVIVRMIMMMGGGGWCFYTRRYIFIYSDGKNRYSRGYILYMDMDNSQISLGGNGKGEGERGG